MKENAKEIWSQIERDAISWYENKESGLKVEAEKYSFRIFENLGRLYESNSKMMECVTSFFLNKDFTRFKPIGKNGEERSFKTFFDFVCRKKYKDEEAERTQVAYSFDEDGELQRRVLKDTVSLDDFTSADNDNDTTLEERLGEKVASSSIDYDRINDTPDAMLYRNIIENTDYISLFLDLKSHLSKREYNSVRPTYFRMFFTDAISYALRRGKEAVQTTREKQILAAMSELFLDFTLVSRCRSFAEIEASSLKLLGEMVDGKPFEETEEPLRDVVFISYLQKKEGIFSASASAVSVQRSAMKAKLMAMM